MSTQVETKLLNDPSSGGTGIELLDWRIGAIKSHIAKSAENDK